MDSIKFTDKQGNKLNLMLVETWTKDEVYNEITNARLDTDVDELCAASYVNYFLQHVDDVKLVSFGKYVNGLTYHFSVGPNGYMEVYDGNWKTLFKGTFADFGKWTAKPLKDLVGKIVRFTYNGGSRSGVRVVKVNSVENGLLKGTDVVKNDIRCYTISNIVGQPEVVN